MKQSDRASPYFGFTDQSVTELHLVFVSQDKVTELRFEFVSRGRLSETYFVVNDQSKATWNARQRIKPGSTLPRDLRWSTTRTEQGIGLLTIPVLAESGSFGQAKRHLPWTSHFLKNSRCNT